MNYRTLSENSLADFATNVMTLLDGSEIEAIDPSTRAGLVAAIGSKPEELAEQTAAASGLKGLRMAAVSTRNATKTDVIELMSQVRDALRAGRASKMQYDLCGFDYPMPAAEMYIAMDPTGLSVNGFSNGINKIRFAGNNRRSSVVYEVWRRSGVSDPWFLHSTTTKRTFIDRSVRPGQYYEYKVRAVAANLSQTSPTRPSCTEHRN